MNYNSQCGIQTPSIACRTEHKGYLPRRMHDTDAGADLFCCENYTLKPGEQKLFDTGVAVKIPRNYVGLVYNRSSQGKKGVIIPHSVGVIDAGFRSNILVLLKNNGAEDYIIIAGDTRIAQLVISPILLCTFEDVWNDTERGAGGFGSTGI